MGLFVRKPSRYHRRRFCKTKPIESRVLALFVQNTAWFIQLPEILGPQNLLRGCPQWDFAKRSQSWDGRWVCLCEDRLAITAARFTKRSQSGLVCWLCSCKCRRFIFSCQRSWAAEPLARMPPVGFCETKPNPQSRGSLGALTFLVSLAEGLGGRDWQIWNWGFVCVGCGLKIGGRKL
jgi:hypothetical protein